MNSAFPKEYVNTEYIATLDLTTNNVLIKDTANSSQFFLLRDPFLGAEKLSPFIFGSGYDIYYMATTQLPEDNMLLSELTGTSYVRVWKVSVLTGTQILIFEAAYKKDSHWAFLAEASAMFVHKNELYFICNSSIRIVNCDTHYTFPLNIESTGNNFAYDGENLLYLNPMYQLCCYNFSTTQVTVYQDVTTSNFILSSQGVYYINLSDNCALYLFDPQTHNKELISPGPIQSLSFLNGKIIYYTAGGEEVCLEK